MRFGDVVANRHEFVDCRDTRRERLVAGQHLDENVLRVDRYGHTDDDSVPPTFGRRFRAGDVLLHSRNVKKLAVPRFDGVTGEKLFVLHPANGEIVDGDFIAGLLLSDSFRRHLATSVRGSVNKFLNWKQLAAFEFTLPNADRQRKIGVALRGSEAALQSWSTAIHELDTLRAVLRRRHFRGGDHETFPIGNVATVRNGTTPHRKEAGYWDGTVPWLPTGKVHESRIREADEHITETALKECPREPRPRGQAARRCRG